jgi:hypothetical protein
MTAPSSYLRCLREEQTTRRLGVAKALREAPEITNVQLATMFGVSRNTIQLDREAIMQQLVASTKTETELLRDGLVKKLEGLVAEVEKHRKDGKLSLGAIDQVLSITKAVIELTGARKPVVEKHEVQHRTISFRTSIVGKDPSGKMINNNLGTFSLTQRSAPITQAEVVEPLTLEAGDL